MAEPQQSAGAAVDHKHRDDSSRSLDSKSDHLHAAADAAAPATTTPAAHATTTTNVATSVGVKRIEAVGRAARKSPLLAWIIIIAVFTLCVTYSLQQSTTVSYEPLATSSFQHHSSGLAASSIATSIIGSVCKPFIAKIADLAGRPITFILTLTLYTLGFVIVAASQTISAWIAGSVVLSIGFNGIQFLVSVIIADLTPLKWRALAQGVSASPYVVTTWIAGYIVSDLSEGQLWRWGYGMFAIIAPACMVPAIAILFHLERKAVKSSDDLEAEEKADPAVARPVEEIDPLAHAPFMTRAKAGLREIDAIGLLLLGFGWSLLLLPFSLASYAENGYSNRSLIAMFVVGGVCLIAYCIFEAFFAPFPTAPKRLLLNKTFVLVVVDNFFYLLGAGITSLYFSSYVYITQDWAVQEWTYSNNTQTMAICVFGVIAGFMFRWLQRYKMLTIMGFAIIVIGQGLLVDKSGVRSGARLILSQALTGIGGAYSSIGSSVASQAAVPHQDVALVISLVGLWASVGSSIGSAIASSVWSNMMPTQLRQELPASVSDAEVMQFFGSITDIRAYAYDSPIRQGAIRAYEKTMFHLWPAALGIAFIPVICSLFLTNYYLGDQQNAYDDVGVDGEVVDGKQGAIVQEDEAVRKSTPWWQFWRR